MATLLLLRIITSQDITTRHEVVAVTIVGTPEATTTIEVATNLRVVAATIPDVTMATIDTSLRLHM